MIRFNKKNETVEGPTIDLTPLIDVVFLLLIFFMVSTSFIHENQLRIELPETTHEEGATPELPIVISINSESQIFWQRQLLQSIDELESQLRLFPKVEDHTWIIQADKLTPHGTVIKVFDVLKRNKIRQLSIATDLVPVK